MASPFLFGATNHAWPFATILGATSAAANFPAANVLMPHRPLVPWRTTNTAVTDCFIDLGSAKVVESIAVFYTNYTTVEFFGDNESSFASPDFWSGSLTIGRNMWNERYSHHHVLVAPVTARYWDIRIPTQATTDGQNYFATGGIYLGSRTTLPVETDPYPGGLEWDEEHTAEEAISFNRTESGGLQVLNLGATPKTVLQYLRIAHVNLAAPGTGDALAHWRLIDIIMRFGPFLWALNYGNQADVWMVRKTSISAWPISFPVSRSPMTLEECIGP